MCACILNCSVKSDFLRLHGLVGFPLPIDFSRQEYCSGLPFLTPGDLPNPEYLTHVSCASFIGRQILYY